jgi:hypothetical protein
MKKPFEPNLPFCKLVRVYRNVHQNCYSVVSVDTGRVIAHADSVRLRDCKFLVNAKGVEKIRATGRKRVVAWVQGYFMGWEGKQAQAQQSVRFNPYHWDSFVDAHGHKVETSWVVDLDPKGWIWASL